MAQFEEKYDVPYSSGSGSRAASEIGFNAERDWQPKEEAKAKRK